MLKLPIASACLLAAATGLIAGAPYASPLPEKVPAKAAAIAWRDVNGRSYGPEDVSKSKATVFFFTSTQCPISNIYAPRMNELAKEFGPKGVKFFAVNANREDALAKVQADAKQKGYAFPAVKDNGTALADRLGARVTPETIILDPAGNVRYRGRIDDNKDRTKVIRQDAREALVAVLNGKEVAFPRTLAAGCAIFREPLKPAAGVKTAAVTFTRDVAPIFNKSCVSCHRDGEVAPFSLQTYAQARTWASQVKDYTARKLMPPWKAVPGHGDFHDARILTDNEIATIARWADAGAPQGNPKDLPPAPQFPSPDEWSLGKPDVVLQPSRVYHLEAEGEDVYRNFVMPIDFEKDTYLSAMEFKPGNRAVVHHMVAYIDKKAASVKMDGKEKEPGYSSGGIGIGVLDAEWGEVWVPGRTPRLLPDGVVIKIPKGSKLVVQVHYHKNGAPQTDLSKTALYYAKGKVEKPVITVPVANAWFVLKPGETRQEVKGSLTIPADITLRTIFPHMHLLGKEMKVTATLPDGTKMPLIYVNDWDFNWQETYEYKQPLKLPKGTKIDMVAVYDNSESNPHQLLNPPREIRFGEGTTDEMCFAFLGFTFDGQAGNFGGFSIR
jgi:thiol-disulfide isomerase/thioredoxin